jgi:hypothetical protein
MSIDLEQLFHNEMVNIYNVAKEKYGYNATRFLQMINNHGGYETAKKLLATKGHPDGLTKLLEENGLEISMEATILKKPWINLFSDNEVLIAKKRLKDLGYLIL